MIHARINTPGKSIDNLEQTGLLIQWDGYGGHMMG